jgi:hypothetical protein
VGSKSSSVSILNVASRAISAAAVSCRTRTTANIDYSSVTHRSSLLQEQRRKVICNSNETAAVDTELGMRPKTTHHTVPGKPGILPCCSLCLALRISWLTSSMQTA